MSKALPLIQGAEAAIRASNFQIKIRRDYSFQYYSTINFDGSFHCRCRVKPRQSDKRSSVPSQQVDSPSESVDKSCSLRQKNRNKWQICQVRNRVQSFRHQDISAHRSINANNFQRSLMPIYGLCILLPSRQRT